MKDIHEPNRVCKMTAIVTLCEANQCFQIVRYLFIEIIQYLWANLSKIHQNFEILLKFVNFAKIVVQSERCLVISI